jgi:hypothetical protein
MTPKEKAEELVCKFYNKLPQWVNYADAKDCAIITVNQLLYQCWDYREIDLEYSYQFWQQVKQEIINL